MFYYNCLFGCMPFAWAALIWNVHFALGCNYIANIAAAIRTSRRRQKPHHHHYHHHRSWGNADFPFRFVGCGFPLLNIVPRAKQFGWRVSTNKDVNKRLCRANTKQFISLSVRECVCGGFCVFVYGRGWGAKKGGSIRNHFSRVNVHFLSPRKLRYL